MTAPKPKPDAEPEPDPPEPGPDDAANHGPVPTEASMIEKRVASLEDRMTKLEERVAAPPIPVGKRP